MPSWAFTLSCLLRSSHSSKRLPQKQPLKLLGVSRSLGGTSSFPQSPSYVESLREVLDQKIYMPFEQNHFKICCHRSGWLEMHMSSVSFTQTQSSKLWNQKHVFLRKHLFVCVWLSSWHDSIQSKTVLMLRKTASQCTLTLSCGPHFFCYYFISHTHFVCFPLESTNLASLWSESTPAFGDAPMHPLMLHSFAINLTCFWFYV